MKVKVLQHLHIEGYRSLFTEVVGKSVLQQTTQTKNDFESNFSYEFFSHFSSLKSQHLSRDEFAKYFSHDSYAHEHNFVVNKLIDHKSWGVHYGRDEHNICAPIPEPESYALLLMGLAMVVMVKRKKS